MRRCSLIPAVLLTLYPCVAPWPAWTTTAGEMVVAHTYEAKIRLDGKVSTTQVQASDAGHAKKLVQAQYVPKVTVLSVKRVD